MDAGGRLHRLHPQFRCQLSPRPSLAASGSRRRRPPRKFAGSRYPSTRLASVPSPQCRLAHSRRDQEQRRRCLARRSTSPTGPASPIDPPPAPKVTISRLGSAICTPATDLSPDSIGCPSRTTAMSVEVPPMSKLMISAASPSRASATAAATPPAGPDSAVPAARRVASATEATPPCDRITSNSPLYPASS